MSEITAKDISEYLDTRDDFDLELFVYRKLLERGIHSSHGSSYFDPQLGKARQSDIRTSIGFKHVGWELNLAIECKSLSTEFPLIVSRVPRPYFETSHYLIRSWSGGGLQNRLEIFEAKLGNRVMLYPLGAPVGKHTFQLRRDPPRNVFKTGDNESYDKWSQALASAADLIGLSCDAHIRHGVPQMFSLVLPVLVVSDNTLWVVDYDEEGRRSDPKSAEECQLFVDRTYKLEPPEAGEYIITHLHIFTRTGFVSFVEGIMAPSSMGLERMFRATASAPRE